MIRTCPGMQCAVPASVTVTGYRPWRRSAPHQRLPGMQEGLEPVQAEGLSAPQLAMVQLLAVLTRWHACLPEAFAEARYDVQRLLPQARPCRTVRGFM